MEHTITYRKYEFAYFFFPAGVCPQFDVLWGELTGMEHLHIYGRVKGMTVKETKMQAYDLLEAVKLTAAANQRTDAYSGGMRRRLR